MGLKRRTLVGLAGGAMAGGAAGAVGPRRPGQFSAGRLDFHQHIVPPGYADWLAQRHAQTFPEPKWSLADAIAANDAFGNQGAYLSLSSPGVQFGNVAESRDYARRCNEYSAKIAATRPDRFGWFAVLVLPDVEGSIAEATYALDVLKADGVVVLANSWGGVYLGHQSFDPLMAELNARKTIMFVHPTALWNASLDLSFLASCDFILDTTRAALAMARRGIPSRYGDLKIILSHGGGGSCRIMLPASRGWPGRPACRVRRRSRHHRTARRHRPIRCWKNCAVSISI